jgi:acetylornithine/N-succinyldiaminopimelate aminotransferase
MLTQRQQFLSFLAPTSPEPLALQVDRAEGVFLYGPDGKRYFDLISGVSVSNIGHSNPLVIKAVQQQAQQYMHLMVYGEFIQSPQVMLAKQLAECLPSNLCSTYFVNSGSEAVEGALKLAKRYTGRSNIVAFNNAYHGSTHGALSLMNTENSKRVFRPLLPGVTHIRFNSLDDLYCIDTTTACVVVEPVQAEAGVIVPDGGFLNALRDRCTEVGALLIFDEIQTGMGRTGYLFALQKYGVVPDILMLAKAFGGGMPLGAFISSREIMQTLSHSPILGHITTFGGHPVSCAAALASLSVIQHQELFKGVTEKATLFTKLLGTHPAVQEVRSSGLIMAFELGTFAKVQRLIKRALEKGVVLDWFLFCSTAFRIAPPLTITHPEIQEACDAILWALDECDS